MLIRDQMTRLPTTGLGGLGKQEKWAAFKVTIQYARDTWVVKGTRIYADPGFFSQCLECLQQSKPSPTSHWPCPHTTVPAMSHTTAFPMPAGTTKRLLCRLFQLVYRASAVGSAKLGSWLGGMLGPLCVEANDCVLQDVMLGKHLLEQKAKPHLSIL